MGSKSLKVCLLLLLKSGCLVSILNFCRQIKTSWDIKFRSENDCAIVGNIIFLRVSPLQRALMLQRIIQAIFCSLSYQAFSLFALNSQEVGSSVDTCDSNQTEGAK